MTKYNIYNPATARRIIHSGIEGRSKIEILPRAMRENVELSDMIAEELMLRHEQDPQNELRLDIVTENERVAMRVQVDDTKVEIVKASKGKR